MALWRKLYTMVDILYKVQCYFYTLIWNSYYSHPDPCFQEMQKCSFLCCVISQTGVIIFFIMRLILFYKMVWPRNMLPVACATQLFFINCHWAVLSGLFCFLNYWLFSFVLFLVFMFLKLTLLYLWESLSSYNHLPLSSQISISKPHVCSKHLRSPFTFSIVQKFNSVSVHFSV